jgi:amino acid permease
MKARLYVQSTGMLVGMIFGAGIFALPYSVAKAGIWWGIIHFLLAFFVIFFLHLLYGEIIFHISGKHRITGYIETLLGRQAKFIAFLFTLFSYYGTLLVYTILGGIFLYNAFPFISAFVWSLSFLILGIFIISFNLKKVGDINFYLSIPLFALVLLLVFLAAFHIETNNFRKLNFLATPFWFLPYGIFIFSFGGFAVLPEIRDILKNNSLADFKKVIKISLFFIAFFYLIFTLSVIGVSGAETSNDALSGIIGSLGETVIKIGSLIGLLAFFTSFIALATDLKNIFRFDYKISYNMSWLLAFLPVLLLFFLMPRNFISIVSAVGAIGLGAFGIFILFMAKKMKKRLSEEGINKGLLFLPSPVVHIIIFALLAGAVYEGLRFFI